VQPGLKVEKRWSGALLLATISSFLIAMDSHTFKLEMSTSAQMGILLK